MTDAGALRDSPDDELHIVIDSLPATSAASRSTARHDRLCADGSTLVVTSVEGGPVQFEVIGAAAEEAS